MSNPRVLILRAAGINCDRETEHAWQIAGAAAERVHVQRIFEKPQSLGNYQILTIPGGFSYGDDIAAGKIFATQLERHLHDQLRAFVEAGKLVLGICNGFQILVKAGLLPYPHGAEDGAATRGESAICTITENKPPGFQDRWVRLYAHASPCVFTEPGRFYELPIAHAEGRVVFADGYGLSAVIDNEQHPLTYVPANATAEDAEAIATEVTWLGGRDRRLADAVPYNPNNSHADIAALCDPTGRVLGMMPHPERYVRHDQHPAWTSRPEKPAGDGLALFRRAVDYFE